VLLEVNDATIGLGTLDPRDHEVVCDKGMGRDRVCSVSTAPTRDVHWTEEDYLRMEADSPIKHEYFEGEIYAMAGASARHNVIVVNVSVALVHVLQGDGCHVFSSDQRIHVRDPKKFYTYADGGVACGSWQISSKDGMSLENPVLLFEVLSPSTRDYDRGAKLFLYKQISSLSDVLLIDPTAQCVEHHHRVTDGWQCDVHHEGAIRVLRGAIQVEGLFQVPPGLPRE
jgi:Uma2 family endonuclease